VKTIYLMPHELQQINEIAGPPPDPVVATRAEARRFRRAIVKAVHQVCGKDVRDYIRGEKQVRVEVAHDPNI